MTQRPLLSVVIPVLNEASRLPLLLADLDRWPDPLEIHVIDGGSHDATPFIGVLGGAIVRTTSCPGRGQQLQLGSRLSQGRWLLVLHADSRLPPTWGRRWLPSSNAQFQSIRPGISISGWTIPDPCCGSWSSLFSSAVPCCNVPMAIRAF